MFILKIHYSQLDFPFALFYLLFLVLDFELMLLEVEVEIVTEIDLLSSDH